jgi:hypothetical protein
MKSIAAKALLVGTILGFLPQISIASSLALASFDGYLNVGNGRPDPEFAEFENTHDS